MSNVMREGTGKKAPLSYILDFGTALDRVAEVMERGALKYARNNWQGGGENATLPILLDSVMRHLKDRMGGQVHDGDMGTDHLANAVAGLLFALYHHGQAPNKSIEQVREELEVKKVQELPPMGQPAHGLPLWQSDVFWCEHCVHEFQPSDMEPCRACSDHPTTRIGFVRR